MRKGKGMNGQQLKRRTFIQKIFQFYLQVFRLRDKIYAVNHESIELRYRSDYHEQCSSRIHGAYYQFRIG